MPDFLMKPRLQGMNQLGEMKSRRSRMIFSRHFPRIGRREIGRWALWEVRTGVAEVLGIVITLAIFQSEGNS